MRTYCSFYSAEIAEHSPYIVTLFDINEGKSINRKEFNTFKAAYTWAQRQLDELESCKTRLELLRLEMGGMPDIHIDKFRKMEELPTAEFAAAVDKIRQEQINELKGCWITV